MRRILRGLRNFFTGRIFLSLLSLAIALGIALYVIPDLYKNQEATIIVCRVRLPLEVGDHIEDRHLELTETGAYNLPVGVILSKEEIIGNYARLPMVPGDFVFPEKLTPYRVDGVLDLVMEEGCKLLTITPRGAAAAVSSHIQPGDLIDVVVLKDQRLPDNTVTRVVYHHDELLALTVYDVENSSGHSLGNTDTEENA
ncbi:MAG: hypothetical protein FWE76_08350, partial [Symbiobacteriaceae bacterium]|nr:hypothetical protein [Symbiobacteriaceae bacterium]